MQSYPDSEKIAVEVYEDTPTLCPASFQHHNRNMFALKRHRAKLSTTTIVTGSRHWQTYDIIFPKFAPSARTMHVLRLCV